MAGSYVEHPMPPPDDPGPSCIRGKHSPRPASLDPTYSTGDVGDGGGASAAPSQDVNGADNGTHRSRGDHATDPVSGTSTGGQTDGRDEVPGRGYSLATFRVASCVHPHRKVAPGSEVHACLGRNVYVLWNSSRRGWPSTVDAFRAADPSCIVLERGAGALRFASEEEGAACGVLHPNRLMFLRGKERSSTCGDQDLSDVQLLLEGPSVGICISWVTGGGSLLTPWEALVGAGLSGWNDATWVHELLLSVLPPLAEAADAQPGTASRMLGRRGRRFVLNAQHWLLPTTSRAPAAMSALCIAADAVDQASCVPVVGPALRLGLLVVQFGALAVLADGHDARRKEAIERCESVAFDVLCRIFAQLREDPSEFGAAYVEQLCSLMARVEIVMEEVESTFFMPSVKAAVAGAAILGWEQRLKDINEKQIASSVHGAVGRAVSRLEKGVDGLMMRVSALGQDPAASAPLAQDLSVYEVGWRPPALFEDHVPGVDKPNRVEFAMVSLLKSYVLGEGAKAPRVGVCAIGGSGKSTACAEVATCKRIRALFPLGTVWVQLNDASTTETVATAVTALLYHLCGEAAARRFQRLTEREDFVALAAAEAQAISAADASMWLVVIDDVRYDHVAVLKQLLLVVPQTTPVLFTTRSEMVVASVTGGVRLAIKSWPEDDARALLAGAVGRQPTKSSPAFSVEEDAAWVGRVLELTQCHVLSVSIVAALVAARCGMWRPVVAALECQWTDPSFQRPLTDPRSRRSVRATLDTSLALLPDDNCRKAFAAVGILPANEHIGVHVLERLWRPHLGFAGGAAQGTYLSRPQWPNVGDAVVIPSVFHLVRDLVRAGVLHQEVADGDLAGIVVHPVVCGYAHSLLGDDCVTVHQRLVDEYASTCPSDDADTHGWLGYHFWATPDDDYWYNNVARHAAATEDVLALASLATDEWLTARTRTGPPSGYQADIDVVLASLRSVLDEADHSVRDSPMLLGASHWGLAMAYLYNRDCKMTSKHEVAIILLRRGLDELSRADAPLQWAEMQNDLGNVYSYRVSGDKAANFQKAVGCYYRALEVRTREAAPLSWAETQHCLGMAYADRQGGNKATNATEAMACFRRALDVRTREMAPLQWAETTYSMGAAYAERVDGDLAAHSEEALACYRRALEVWTRDAAPQHWAKTQHSMGVAYAERLDGDKAANMEEAMACYFRALEVRTQDVVPLPWAVTQSCMGAAYLQRLGGDKEANFEKAVACYWRSLDVWTRETMPAKWASTQLKLASMHERMGGDRAAKQENWEDMMACYLRALGVWTREAAPHDWAKVQDRIGTSWAERLDGDKAANLEDALTCYRRALEVRTRLTAPRQWARTQHNMGVAYAQRLDGDNANSMEEALACYRGALEVFTRQTESHTWAMLQRHMAAVYVLRVDGDKAANMEDALACYRRALEVWRQETSPLDWARAQQGMGAAYAERVDGDKAGNLKEAIACYRRTLEVWTRETVPHAWAQLHDCMGTVYAQRVVRDKSADLEDALACYRLVLDVWTRQTAPMQWAKTQHNMGAVYARRLDGNKAANMEEALACYRRALEVWERQTAPLHWARAQYSMGAAYAERVDGGKAANIEEALVCFRGTLDVWTRETAPHPWAQTQDHLSVAYTKRLEGDKAENMEEALACYRRALEVWTRQAVPDSWANMQRRMGAAYLQRVDGDRAANLEESMACYRRALMVWTREASPLQWASTQLNLAHGNRRRMTDNGVPDMEEALACFQRALEVLTQDAAPLQWAKAQHGMGLTYAERVVGDRTSNWDEAVTCYCRALKVRTREAEPQLWASSTWRLMLALQGGKHWTEALDKARALQTFGREWKRWDELEASLATRVAELKSEVAQPPVAGAIREPQPGVDDGHLADGHLA